MTKQKLPTIKSLREDSPWAIAEKFGVEYTGDMCSVPHGGTFYETRNWEKFGYANGIRIEEFEGECQVELITINKPDDMSSAFAFCGFAVSADNPEKIKTGSGDELERTPQVEIECALGCCGADSCSGKNFRSDNGRDWGDFPEFQIMRAVRDYFPSLLAE